MDGDPLGFQYLTHEELMRVTYRLLEDEKVWRQRWKEEQEKRLTLQAIVEAHDYHSRGE